MATKACICHRRRAACTEASVRVAPRGGLTRLSSIRRAARRQSSTRRAEAVIDSPRRAEARRCFAFRLTRRGFGFCGTTVTVVPARAMVPARKIGPVPGRRRTAGTAGTSRLFDISSYNGRDFQSLQINLPMN